MVAARRSAIVLGASMSGLLAARALCNHFEMITIVDRDVLPEAAAIRKGVPQSGHAHGLLASGYRVMDEFFPGMMDELEAGGAPRGDVVGDFLWFQYGKWKLRHRSGLLGMTVSRPALEAAIRQRVRALPNVKFLEGTDGVKPDFDAAAQRVTGLRVWSRDRGAERVVPADLVVDASGRGSQSPKRLEEWGFGRPRVQVVKVDVGYATRVFRRRPGDFFGSNGGIVTGTAPEEKRYAAILAAEGDRWVVTLAGILGDHPPADDTGWAKFAATLPVPDVYELVTRARPLTEITTYRFMANERRYYERMKRFPEGFLVIGDAVCSFNPLYGQGMSVAAGEARALDQTLASRREPLAQRFYARARKVVDIPWLIATGEDLRYPEVDGPRPLISGLLNRYLDRVHAMASVDPVVCRRFFDVLNLLAPPSALMSPRVMWRVLTRRPPQEQGSPWGAAATPS